MKLLFVGTYDENNGAATHFVTLARALAEAGHDVDAIVRPDGLIWEGLAYSGVHRHAGVFRNALDLRGYATTARCIRHARPDWIVGNFGKEYWPLVLLGRGAGIPVALFRHRPTPMKRLSAWWLPRLAARFFAVSRHAREAYVARGIRPDRVQVLYNPVDTTLFCPDPAAGEATRQAMGLPPDAIVLGFAGRMHQGKGVHALMAAANQAMAVEPRLHCLWLGDGPEAAALRETAFAATRSERHHFVGWHHDTAPYLRSLSMLAFPSVSTETFGRVSIEAQACGVPVLASDIGGIPETLLPGETGLLLPPGNLAAWRDAILALCDEGLRQTMGTAARGFVERHFALPVIADAFVAQLRTARAPRSATLTGLDAGSG